MNKGVRPVSRTVVFGIGGFFYARFLALLTRRAFFVCFSDLGKGSTHYAMVLGALSVTSKMIFYA